MKKALALLLALVMCLSLCACASSPKEKDTPSSESITENDSADIILGTWTCSYIRSDKLPNHRGDNCTNTYVFHKGGTAKGTTNCDDDDVVVEEWSATWELYDETTLLVTVTSFGSARVYNYTLYEDNGTYCLQDVDHENVIYSKQE